MPRWLILALLVVASAAYAERPLSHYVQGCGLAGTPGSVVVDVYNAASPGSVLATLPNAVVTRIGTSDCYQVNLTGASGVGYPASGDPNEKHYVVNFRDDASTSVWVSETVMGLPGAQAIAGRCEKVTPVYASSPIPTRGITQAAINEGKPSYLRVDVACDLDFTTPDATYYETMIYDSSGRVSSRTPSPSPPAP